MLQLLAFLCGGFAMGVGLGLVVLFIFRSTPLVSGHVTMAKIQIAIGLLALLVAVLLATNVSSRKTGGRAPVDAPVGGNAGVAVMEPAPASSLEKVSARIRQLLQGDSLWVAGVSGLGTALPSANYLAAMAIILASGAAPAVQVQALVVFNVLAFTLAEIPLVSYLAAPQKTRECMAALHEWLQSRSRRDAAALVAVAGCAMLALGGTGL